MSALSELKDKKFVERVPIEKCIVECWDKCDGMEYIASVAAADLAALNARVEELEALLSRCVERVEFAAECDADGENGDAELLRYIRAALKGAE